MPHCGMLSASADGVASAKLLGLSVRPLPFHCTTLAMSCPAPRLAASVLGLLYSNRGVNPSVTAYAVPPFHSSTWSPRFVRKAHLRCSLFHWGLRTGLRFAGPVFRGCGALRAVLAPPPLRGFDGYGLFPPLAAAFVRPFFLREKGGFWQGNFQR